MLNRNSQLRSASFDKDPYSFRGRQSGSNFNLRRSFQRSSSNMGGWTSSQSSSQKRVVATKSGVLSSSGSLSTLPTAANLANKNISYSSVGHSHGVGRDGSGSSRMDLLSVEGSRNVVKKGTPLDMSKSEAFRETVERRQEKPKIVFLDVDGVLHSVRVTRQEQLFNAQKMTLLRRLLQQTDAQIVLSSAWRRTAATLRMAYAMLQRHGIPTPIDVTPDFGPQGRRSAEILTWVDRFGIKDWVAIDDLDLLTGEPRLKGHFLRCNPLVGLTNELIEEGTRNLNRDLNN
jgi:hypothetical protein